MDFKVGSGLKAHFISTVYTSIFFKLDNAFTRLIYWKPWPSLVSLLTIYHLMSIIIFRWCQGAKNWNIQ